jgi:hypothetical protein
VWTDRAVLRDVQYSTDANLAARQSLYAHQRPPLDLPARMLELAALRGDEAVTDVGCGNWAATATPAGMTPWSRIRTAGSRSGSACPTAGG